MPQEKVLILSYFFPPCNLTAANRIQGWARHLSQLGYYPVIITRRWDHEINTLQDMGKATENKLLHIRTGTCEVFHLPYVPNLRDRIHLKPGRFFTGLRKALSFAGLVGQNWSNAFIPYSNLFSFADQYLSENRDVRKMVVSGNPFVLFRFGNLLHKKHGIKWIADYRDDWSTSEINRQTGLYRLIAALEAISEKEWTGSASLITSVSPYLVEKISRFTGKPGHVVLNGFDEEEVIQYRGLPLYETFTITYSGTLYETQPVEVFLEGVKQVLERGYRIQVRFPGLGVKPDQAGRVLRCMGGYREHIQVSNRIARREALLMQGKSHLLLMVAHSGTRGIPSSKLYEYIGLNRPVLLCPSDSDIIESTLMDSGLGLVANHPAEVAEHIIRLIHSTEQHADFTEEQHTRIQRYSGASQAAALVACLDSL
jgi:glycosyltransferase involved in cell wall biosynthesis